MYKVLSSLLTLAAVAGTFQAAKAVPIEDAGNHSIAVLERQQQNTEEPKAVAAIAEELAIAYLKMNRLDLAEQNIARSLKYPTPRTYNTKGSIEVERGEYATAAKSFQIAAREYRQSKDYEGQLGATINQALALQKLGQYQQAKQILEEVERGGKEQITMRRRSGKIPLELLAAYKRSIGQTYATIGDYRSATEALEDAIAMSDDAELKAAITLDLGNIYAVEEPAKAYKYYQSAAIETENKATRASALINSVIPLYELDKSERATENLTLAAADIARLENNLESKELKLKEISRKIYLQEKLAKSFVNEKDLLWLRENAQSSRLSDRSYALGYLGRIAQMQNRPTEAISYYRRGVQIATTIDEPQIAYQWQHQLGRVYKSLGQDRLAIEAYKNSVDNINQVRGDLITYSLDRQHSFKENLEPVYRELVTLLTKDPTQEHLIAARNTIESLQVIELENYFRSSCLNAKTERIDNIDPEAAAIYPIILEDKLVTIVALKDRPLEYHEIAVSSDRVRETVSNFLFQLNLSGSNKRRKAYSEKIYSWLIAPHREKLEQHRIKTLVFVLDSEIRNLPLATLEKDDRYLIQDYRLAVAPGLQLVSDPKKSSQTLNAVVGGLSESNQNFTALPGVETEVREIARDFDARLLLNKNFTIEKLKQTLKREKDSEVLHLATHGQFSSDPEETFILTWNDRINVEEMDSLLRVRQKTPRLKPIELLILSACNTVTGDERAALGLAGVALRSGARSTIGTLWAVNDVSTSIFARSLYKGLDRNLGKAESLRQAQLKLIESQNYAHPYYWGAFVMVGNWQG